ncbi:putative molybdopterin converting factor subunit 2 [Candidatus Gastranaerophilus sp. (ex Termes propinquus)]|nr:putative molybdopterin converting factor subunit 2 [Candidatus Gastranaerophilus sp. (ex Termes propinquus)]
MSTSNKYFILTADDFGMSETYDNAVLTGYLEGFLTSACICTNGLSYDYALSYVLPKCENIDLGVHLNIIEGKSLTDCPLLTDEEGYFRYGFLSLLLKSQGLSRKKFLNQVELEFRAQIEKLKNDLRSLSGRHQIVFLNSHVHTHAIENIFEITARLSREYGIKFIRTQSEKLYTSGEAVQVPRFVNILKVLILNYLSLKNRKRVEKYGLLTNDYILGVGYTGEMSEDTIYCGAKSLSGAKFGSIVEALIHPSDDKYADEARYREFEASLSLRLKEDIEKLGFKVSGFRNLSEE